MKILKLLNKKYFSIIFALVLVLNSYAEDKPVDIWELDKKNIESKNQNSNEIIQNEEEIKNNSELGIYEMQPSNKKEIEKIISNENFKIVK